MRGVRGIAIALTVLAVTAAAWAAEPSDGYSPNTIVFAERVEREFNWSGRIPPGGSIEVRSVNGNVRAERSSGDRAQLTASRRGPATGPSDVEVLVVQHAGGIVVCAVYAGARSADPTECLPGRPASGSRAGALVDFTLRVPAGVPLIARTVSGRIEADSLASDVEAHTVDGDVGIATTGHAVAETVNGSITATLRQSRWARPLEFRTINGAVTVELPGNAGARLLGRTVNGEISADFPSAEQRTCGRSGIEAVLGGGGADVLASTVNGDVRFRRAPRVAWSPAGARRMRPARTGS